MDSISNEDVKHDFQPFLKVYKDGRIHRYQTIPIIPPVPDSVTGVRSKDVVISPENGIKARIFIPYTTQLSHKKIPVLVHYHGGGFCVGSASDIFTNNVLTSIVPQANVIAVSIEYRLAPEHPLPVAYDDSWVALQWLMTHVNGLGPEEWINDYADLGQVFLAGDSAGGNIAHNMAVWAGARKEKELPGMRVIGLIVVHPYFAEEEDELIKYLYPGNKGFKKDPILNPKVDPDLKKIGCERVLVAVAEKDGLKERGVGYYGTMVKSGWGGKVEFYETKGAGHCFHYFDPKCENAENLFGKMAEFINDKA